VSRRRASVNNDRNEARTRLGQSQARSKRKVPAPQWGQGRGAKPATPMAGKAGARAGLAPRLPLRGATHALFYLLKTTRRSP
jgi:hypothetical protein